MKAPKINDRSSKPRFVFSRKDGVVLFVLIAVVCLILFLIFRKAISRVFPFSPDHSPVAKVVNVADIRFDHPSVLKDWKEYVFNKRSEYKVEPDPNGEMVLHAASHGGYSIIFKVVNIPLAARPILAWQWRAQKFPSNKKRQSLSAENENDFAIRICAIFAKNNPLVTDVVQYLWDDYFSVGTHASSPYSKNVQMLVVQSGSHTSSKEWLSEKRDLVSDYKKLFEKTHYGNLRAIAIISNSDDTQTESEAYVKRIWIESANAKRIHKNQRRIPKDIRSLLGVLRSFRHLRLPVPKGRRLFSMAS